MKTKVVSALFMSALLAASGLAPAAMAQNSFRTPRAVDSQACRSQQAQGGVAGGVLGAVLGSAVASKGRKTEGAVLGGILGAVIGSQTAKHLSECGRLIALEKANEAAYYNRPAYARTPDGRELTLTPVSDQYVDQGVSCVDIGLTIANPDGTVSSASRPIKSCKDPVSDQWSADPTSLRAS